MTASAAGKSIRKEKRRWLDDAFIIAQSHQIQSKIKSNLCKKQNKGRADGKAEKNACETGGNVL